jgi:hypothetical protein
MWCVEEYYAGVECMSSGVDLMLWGDDGQNNVRYDEWTVKRDSRGLALVWTFVMGFEVLWFGPGTGVGDGKVIQ